MRRYWFPPGTGIASESGQLPQFIERFYLNKSFFGIYLSFEALLEFFGAKLSLLSEHLYVPVDNRVIALKAGGALSVVASRFSILAGTFEN